MEYIIEISKHLIEGIVKTGAVIEQATCIEGLPANARLKRILVFKNGNIGALFSDGGLSGPEPIRKQIVYRKDAPTQQAQESASVSQLTGIGKLIGDSSNAGNGNGNKKQ